MQGAALHLARLIESGGPVSVATFMEIALAHPEHGYYRRNPRIGADGDFITAPEVSQLFGEMIGIFALQAWLDLGAPRRWQIIELGPGLGTLMADLVRTLRSRPQALEALEIHLVETSRALRVRQADALKPHGIVPRFHDRLATIVHGPAVLIANEFFDALPIRQFVRLRGVWCERRVGLVPGSDPPAFRFIAAPTLHDVEADCPSARATADGRILEISEPARAIAGEIAARLARAPGHALIIDYGYSAERHGDTLQALRSHGKTDPLAAIGDADLTAHVDLAALATAACQAGAAAFGPVAQRAFLASLGIAMRHAALARKATPDQRRSLDLGLERLTAANQMGDLFRVLALATPHLPPPPGFERAP